MAGRRRRIFARNRRSGIGRTGRGVVLVAVVGVAALLLRGRPSELPGCDEAAVRTTVVALLRDRVEGAFDVDGFRQSAPSDETAYRSCVAQARIGLSARTVSFDIEREPDRDDYRIRLLRL